MAVEEQLEVATLGGVQDPPALRRSRSHRQPRLDAAVHEHVGALASEHHSGRPPRIRRLEPARFADADVAQHEDDLVLDADRVGWILDENRAVETEADLRGRHDVRVIPEQPGVRHDEVVGERTAWLHLGLRVTGHTVHLNRNPQAVPVNGRRLWQMVGEAHDEPIAYADADERARDAAVVGPRVDRHTWRDLHGSDARVEIDLDDPRIGVAVDRFAETQVGIPAFRLVAGVRARNVEREGHQQGGCHGRKRAVQEHDCSGRLKPVF